MKNPNPALVLLLAYSTAAFRAGKAAGVYANVAAEPLRASERERHSAGQG